jgi:disulfide bond formation protein DsbB
MPMTSERRAPLLLFLVSAAVVGTALLSQYVGGLAPCELCLYERWPYYGVAAVALAAAVIGSRMASRMALVGAVLAFLAGAGLAFYHVGVEQHWFAGPAACTAGNAGPPANFEEYKRRLMQQQVVACDQPQWTLFGVSLAGFNLLASLFLAVGSLAALRPGAGMRRS